MWSTRGTGARFAVSLRSREAGVQLVDEQKAPPSDMRTALRQLHTGECQSPDIRSNGSPPKPSRQAHLSDPFCHRDALVVGTSALATHHAPHPHQTWRRMGRYDEVLAC
jgi:hypothetical protein